MQLDDLFALTARELNPAPKGPPNLFAAAVRRTTARARRRKGVNIGYSLKDDPRRAAVIDALRAKRQAA